MKRHDDFAPALTVYRKKRDFSKTREPSGERQRSAVEQGTYIIQKHAARRLHYDFRLELDGTLKSWAVTRGPSINPADKRLAVHVEDHPLDYATFEGTIPQGQYGGGTVMLWDRGTWEAVGNPQKDYAKGRLTFILHGKRLKGEWHLVRMGGKAAGKKRENWLLIKSHDQYADERNGDRLLEREKTSVASGRSMEKIAQGNKEWTSNRAQTKQTKTVKKSAQPRQSRKTKSKSKESPPDFVAPQLATLVSDPPVTKDWVHEIKFDGYRALCRIDGDDVRLITRANNNWTDKFGSIADQIHALEIDNALLDGEIVALDVDGAMSFHNLQQALSKGQQERLHYHLFDLLFLNGQDWRQKPLLERKKALRAIIPKDHPHIHYSEHFENPGTDVLRHACHIALEGIVSKRTNATYHSGRGESWLKSKCTNEQEFVIGGYTCQAKHSHELGAMLIGYYEDKELLYACKVGTGFSHEEAQQLLKKFKPLKQKEMPFASMPRSERAHANWIEPHLVAAVEFTEWTEGGALRHPSYQGLREDKPASEVKREKKKAPPPGTRAKPLPETRKAAMPSKPNVIEGVALTHPDKILYRDERITKKDIAEYYDAIADWMLPHVTNRPMSLVRCPEGSGKPCFFQRHSGEGLSEHIKQIKIDVKGEREPYISIEDVRGLIAAVQMGALEIHIWGSRADKPELPDRIVFDFDPGEDVPWNKVKDAAIEMKQRLADIKLTSFLKVTGGKGLHVVVPMLRKPDWKMVKTFTREMAAQMAKDKPKLFTINSRKVERKGKIFIDYLRNDMTASAIAPYSTRARAGAPVAVPIGWEELTNLKSAHSFTMPLVMARLKKQKNDPWKDMNKIKQSLPT